MHRPVPVRVTAPVARPPHSDVADILYLSLAGLIAAPGRGLSDLLDRMEDAR